MNPQFDIKEGLGYYTNDQKQSKDEKSLLSQPALVKKHVVAQLRHMEEIYVIDERPYIEDEIYSLVSVLLQGDSIRDIVMSPFDYEEGCVEFSEVDKLVSIRWEDYGNSMLVRQESR